MFDPTSRYHTLPLHYHVDAEQRTIAYVARRILPQPEGMAVLARVTSRAGDRLDQYAARTLGNPTLFWRIADANNALDPMALTAVPGRELVVPTPKVGG